MYLTQKNQLRGLSKKEYAALRSLCALSKNLYNVTLYAVRQRYFADGGYLPYESAYHICKENENYRLMGTDTAQQTMKAVDRSIRSFFALLESAKSGGQARLPHYLPKDGLFTLTVPRIRVKGGCFDIPMSPAFKREHGKVRIRFPSNLSPADIREIRIHPKHGGAYFEVEYVREVAAQPARLDFGIALAVDLGLDNLATCATSTGASFIVDGKKLKSINQWWNKENARLQGIKDKQGIEGTTRKQYLITRKRNNRVNDYLSKTARTIVNYCLGEGIGNVVVGCNPEWKRGIDIGRVSNQNFVCIPHGRLRLKLRSLCDRYGISYVEQEESYTSKADFFAGDDLPTYNPGDPQTHTFSGRRISRGQYRSSNGNTINADCNGALNILRKSKLVGLGALQRRGRLDRPKRIQIL